jgi:hypothetical protein
MTETTSELEPSRLQRAVEAIAISPEGAGKLVEWYRRSFRKKFEREPVSTADKRQIASKVIDRYSKSAAATGAAAALPGVIPGVGTAVAVIGGGAADIAASLKIQIDMCICLVDVFEDELSSEDKKHLAFVLALAGSIEGLANKTGKVAVEKVAQKLVFQYIKGPALQTIKELFKKVGVIFLQKTAAKAIPAGVGVVFSGSTNYVLTTVVGKIAVTVLTKDV